MAIAKKNIEEKSIWDDTGQMLRSARTCLADGWAGSMIATEISDILFGTPSPRKSMVSLGVIKEDQVNILVHGHTPIASEKIVEAVNDPGLIALARGKGAAGKAGLLVPEAIEMAGPGLKEICGALGIPPVLHMGSCVDNACVLQLAALLANERGVDISDLPLAGSSPEWYSEKAAAIGTYCVASGDIHPPRSPSQHNRLRAGDQSGSGRTRQTPRRLLRH